MILRRLRAARIRRHNRPVEIRFNEHLTVIEGPNEIGKSTLFTAIEYAFFRRSSANGEDIKRLEPWDGNGLRPHIIIDFSYAGQEYRVEKDWSGGGRTIVSKLDAAGVATTYMIDGADDWLLALFSGEGAAQGFHEFKSTHLGLAHLLFARQGGIVLPGDSKGLNDASGGRLTALVGAVAQSDDEARMIDRIDKKFNEFWTPGWKRKKTAMSGQHAASAADLKNELQVIEAARAEFSDIGLRLNAAQAELQLAREGRDRNEARFSEMLPRVTAAFDARVVLDGTEHDLSEKKRIFDDIVHRLQRIGDLDRDRTMLMSELAPKEAVRESARLHISAAESTIALATNAFAAANMADPILEDAQVLVERARRAQADKIERDRWQTVLLDVVEIDREMAQIAMSSPPDSPTLADVQALHEMLACRSTIEIQLRAAETIVSIRPTSGISITDRGRQHKLAAGEDLELTGQRVVFSIDGLAEIEARGPIVDVDASRIELSQLNDRLGAFGRQFSSIDSEIITRLMLEAAERDSQLKSARLRRQERLAGRDLAELEAQVADLSSRLAASEVAGDLAMLEANLERLSTLHKQRREAAHQAFDQARTAAGVAQEQVRAAEAACLDTNRRIGDVNAALGALLTGTDIDSLRNQRASAEVAWVEAGRAETAARKAYEPYREFDDPSAELQKLQNTQKSTHELVTNYNKTIAGLEARFEQLQQQGLFTRYNEIESKLASETSAHLFAETEENAILLLQRTIQAVLSDRRAGLGVSIERRVAPWFERVTNVALAGLELGSVNQIASIQLPTVRSSIDFRELSAGTADQLGALVRLAFADLLADGEALPVLLDDPLVNADSRRRAVMLDIMREVSQRAQIIVFTCRRDDYLESGAKICSIEPVTDAA